MLFKSSTKTLKKKSLKNTQMRRPDLIDRSKLTEDQVKVIDDLKNDPENL